MASVEVSVPVPLRRFAGGRAVVAVGGASVREVLAALAATEPELGRRVFDETGRPHRSVRVFLNGSDLGALAGMDTEVADGDRVDLVLAATGG